MQNLSKVVVIFNSHGERVPVMYIPIPLTRQYYDTWVQTVEGNEGTIDGRRTVNATMKEKLEFKTHGI